jgi:hypothetical protein
MWGSVKKLLGHFGSFNALLGDVVFETPPVSGQSASSEFQWRVKQGTDGRSLFVSLKCKPDSAFQVNHRTRAFIEFDLATAERVRADLDACIAELQRRAKLGPALSPGAPLVRRQ